MTDSVGSSQSSPEFGDYVAVVRRHPLLLVMVTLLVSAVGLVLAGGRAPESTQFTATTEVLPPTAAESASPLEGEVEFARSDQVETAALESSGLDPDTKAFSDAVIKQAAEGSGVLAISVTAEDPETALTASEALAEAYLQEREASFRAARTERSTRSAEEITAVTTELREQTDILAASDAGSPEAASASALISVLQNQLTRLRTDASVALLDPVTSGTVVTATQVTQSGNSSLPRSALIAASLALGLLVALGAVFVIDRLDPSVRSPVDAQRVLGNVIGEVPFVYVALSPGSLPPALQQTATAARFAAAARGGSALVLAEVLPTSTPSHAIVNIAIAHVQAHRQTLLLSLNGEDADVPDVVGLDQVRLPTPVDSESDGLQHAVQEQLGGMADGTAFIHCNPALSSPDACDLAVSLGVLVLVARVGRTRREDLAAAGALARRAGVPSCWTVVELAPTVGDRVRRLFGRSPDNRNDERVGPSRTKTIAA